MAFNKDTYYGRDLERNVRALSEDCEHEAGRLAARVRSGRSGYGARGRVEALKQSAGWLERIAGNSLMAIDLATNINDFILCLQQCVDDEEGEYRLVLGRHRKRLDTCEQHRLMAKARGKASAYADVEDILSFLLVAHYPRQTFPLTFTAGSLSHDEWERLVEPGEASIEEEGGAVFGENDLVFKAWCRLFVAHQLHRVTQTVLLSFGSELMKDDHSLPKDNQPD